MKQAIEITSAAALLLAVSACGSYASAAENLDGFTEPFRNIDVASAEPGLITRVEVKEGETVTQGQILAMLDHEVLKASLAVAKANMESIGQLKSARAELRMRTDRLGKLERLLTSNNATEEEVEMARAEVEIAEARVLAADEALEVRRLEYKKIEAQIERRMIRSPIDGIVTAVFKDEGEFVSPTDPIVMNVVQLDPLLATFSLSEAQASQYSIDQQVSLSVGASSSVPGRVVFVSPINDAQSGLVRVRVRIENEDLRYRSGTQCTLLTSAEPAAQVGTRDRRGAVKR